MDRCSFSDARRRTSARLIVVLRGTEGVGDARMVHVVDRGAITSANACRRVHDLYLRLYLSSPRRAPPAGPAARPPRSTSPASRDLGERVRVELVEEHPRRLQDVGGVHGPVVDAALRMYRQCKPARNAAQESRSTPSLSKTPCRLEYRHPERHEGTAAALAAPLGAVSSANANRSKSRQVCAKPQSVSDAFGP